MPHEIVEMKAIVHGRVQGVFFRATTKEYAHRLGEITGTVRNVEDGTVEIIAQGERQKLDRLLEMLQGKDGAGKIDRIETVYRVPVDHYPDFRVKH